MVQKVWVCGSSTILLVQVLWDLGLANQLASGMGILPVQSGNRQARCLQPLGLQFAPMVFDYDESALATDLAGITQLPDHA